MPRGAPPWSILAVAAAGSAYALDYYLQVHSYQSLLTHFAAIYGSLVFLQLVWIVYVWPRWVSSLRYLPHAPGATSFFQSFWFITAEEAGLNHREWINSVPNDGLLRYLLLGGMERIFLTSPKAMSEAYVVRNYDYRRPEIATDILSRLLGLGLLLAEGDEHRLQRKNLTPAFSYRHVRDLVPTFMSISMNMAGAIAKEIELRSPQSKSVIVAFDNWISRATLDIVGAAGLGFDFGTVDDPSNELSVTYRSALRIGLQEQLLQFASLFFPFRYLEHLPLSRNREVREARRIIRTTSRALIEKKQQEIAEKGFSEHRDILSIALQSGNFTVDQLVDQVMTFLAAGHETTATASQWAMVTLARHPEMQQKLRNEIRDWLPSINAEHGATSEEIDGLPYLRAFCQEVLRFWPPVPFTEREAVRDTQILGHHIPKGTHIVVVPSAICHSKELWGADADQFRLERWLEPGCATTGGAESPYAQMTFGTGPRGCIGATFAKYELQCLVAAIVGRFEIELDPPGRSIELETSVVTRPKGGLPLRMTIVDGW